MQPAASPDRKPEENAPAQAKTVPATPPPPPEFPDRRSVEALDRLARTIPVDIGKHAATITLPSDDYFDVGGAKLTDSARWRLDDVARALAAQSGRTIVVRVYTDTLGDRSESLRLSQDRATTLRDYLMAKGVPLDVLRAEGMGPEHPVADNATAAGRASNRRIEVVIEVNHDSVARR
jgi:outer membrane protein OmpA-like peptidoglycan-associated protein